MNSKIITTNIVIEVVTYLCLKFLLIIIQDDYISLTLYNRSAISQLSFHEAKSTLVSKVSYFGDQVQIQRILTYSLALLYIILGYVTLRGKIYPLRSDGVENYSPMSRTTTWLRINFSCNINRIDSTLTVLAKNIHAYLGY